MSTTVQTNAEPASDPQEARPENLRHIVADGAAFSAMVGLGETYVPAFALAAGFGELVAGMIASLPMLAGALLQLATPRAVHLLGSYRRWTVLCAVLQASSFVPLFIGAAAGTMTLPWLVGATVAYWGFGMATGPAWNAWVTSLVPKEIRPSFFARRTRIAQTSLFIAMVLAGVALEWGRTVDAEGLLFAGLFVTAALCRLGSSWHLSRQTEAPGLARSHPALPAREVVRAIRSAGSGRVFAYLVGMQAAVWIAAPFFTPYMLGPIGLSYAEYMALTAAAFAARIAIMPALGRWAHEHGTKALLWAGAVGIVFLPVMWLVSHTFAYLLVLQLAAGSAWAALEFATMLTFFEGVRDAERASVLTGFNLANALAIAVGTVAGGALFAWMDAAPETYALLFALSTVGRAAMLLVLHGTQPARTLLDMRFRTIAVRPSAGAVSRPILATAGEAPRGSGGESTAGSA